MRIASGLLLGWILSSSVAAAQSASVGGTVLRDSLGHPLGEATVLLRPLGASTRTNYLGEFRFQSVPRGRYAIEIRHVGFAPLVDSVTAGDSGYGDLEYVMREQPARLDSVRVQAAGAMDFLYRDDFEFRRKTGFGRFIDGDEIRKSGDNHSFFDFIVARLPGMSLKATATPDRHVWPSTGRKPCKGPAFQCRGVNEPCYVAIYVDGIVRYLPSVSNTGQPGAGYNEPPVLGDIRPEDLAAVEFYASGATAPSQYNGTGSDCGVLLLWRRTRS